MVCGGNDPRVQAPGEMCPRAWRCPLISWAPHQACFTSEMLCTACCSGAAVGGRHRNVWPADDQVLGQVGKCEFWSLSCMLHVIQLLLLSWSSLYKLTASTQKVVLQICDDGFTNAAATVACRQLQFSGAGIVVPNTFGSAAAAAPIWVSNVKCLGTEASVADCKHLGWGVSNWCA